jgi:hypothetical protein
MVYIHVIAMEGSRQVTHSMVKYDFITTYEIQGSITGVRLDELGSNFIYKVVHLQGCPGDCSMAENELNTSVLVRSNRIDACALTAPEARDMLRVFSVLKRISPRQASFSVPKLVYATPSISLRVLQNAMLCLLRYGCSFGLPDFDVANPPSYSHSTSYSVHHSSNVFHPPSCNKNMLDTCPFTISSQPPTLPRANASCGRCSRLHLRAVQY